MTNHWKYAATRCAVVGCERQRCRRWSTCSVHYTHGKGLIGAGRIAPIVLALALLLPAATAAHAPHGFAPDAMTWRAPPSAALTLAPGAVRRVSRGWSDVDAWQLGEPAYRLRQSRTVSGSAFRRAGHVRALYLTGPHSGTLANLGRRPITFYFWRG
jgi:hypothetical protein